MRHYAEHEGKPFFASLLEFITSGPVVAAIVEGRGPLRRSARSPVAPIRSRRPRRAPSAVTWPWITQDNLVHGSDSPESADREIELWFPGR